MTPTLKHLNTATKVECRMIDTAIDEYRTLDAICEAIIESELGAFPDKALSLMMELRNEKAAYLAFLMGDVADKAETGQ